MTYCNTGDQAKVTYQFNDGERSAFETKSSPIEVTTGKYQNTTTSNYNPEGYQITFGSPQAQYGSITLTVVDYQVSYIDKGVFDSATGYYIKFIPCGSTSFPPTDAANPGAKMSSPNVTVNNAVKCPVANPSSDLCEIKISANGNVIFQAHGKCPVSFTVACGDACPPGFCKCPSPGYPGYCCLDCKATAASIHAITNDLNYKNYEGFPNPTLT